MARNVVKHSEKHSGRLSTMKLSVILLFSLAVMCVFNIFAIYKFSGKESYSVDNVFVNTKDNVKRKNCACISKVLRNVIHHFSKEDIINMYADHEVYTQVTNDEAKTPLGDLTVDEIVALICTFVSLDDTKRARLKDMLQTVGYPEAYIQSSYDMYKHAGLDDYFKYLRDFSGFCISSYVFFKGHMGDLIICANIFEDPLTPSYDVNHAIGYVDDVLKNYFGIYDNFYNHSRDIFNQRLGEAAVMSSSLTDISTWLSVVEMYMYKVDDYMHTYKASLSLNVRKVLEAYESSCLSVSSASLDNMFKYTNLLYMLTLDKQRYDKDLAFIFNIHKESEPSVYLISELRKIHTLINMMR